MAVSLAVWLASFDALGAPRAIRQATGVCALSLSLPTCPQLFHCGGGERFLTRTRPTRMPGLTPPPPPPAPPASTSRCRDFQKLSIRSPSHNNDACGAIDELQSDSMNRKRRRVHFSVEREVNVPEGTCSLIESSSPKSRCSDVQIVTEARSRGASCSSEDFLNEPEVCYGGVGLPILV
jgi:hypothetical protein